MAPAQLVAPVLTEPTLTVRLESATHGLNLGLHIVVESKELHLHKLISGLRLAGIVAEVSDLSSNEEMTTFTDKLQLQESQRQEVHQFYTEVAKQFARMGETLQRMRKEYYQEIDHLRNQLSLQKRDPSFVPDSVMFFDPSAYQIPPWHEIVSQLDSLRMKRELLKKELGGDRIQRVPLHMLCQHCRRHFQSPEEEWKWRREHFCERGSQTESITCTNTTGTFGNISVQTDWEWQPWFDEWSALHGRSPFDLDSASTSGAEGEPVCKSRRWPAESAPQKQRSNAKRRQPLSKKELASRMMARRIEAYNKHLMRCAFAQLKQHAGLECADGTNGLDEDAKSLPQAPHRQERLQFHLAAGSTAQPDTTGEVAELGGLAEALAKVGHKDGTGEELPETFVNARRGRHSQNASTHNEYTSTHSKSASAGTASNESASGNGRSKGEPKAHKRGHSHSSSEYEDREECSKPAARSADNCGQKTNRDSSAQPSKHRSAKVLARRLEAHRRHALRYAMGRLQQGLPLRDVDVQALAGASDERTQDSNGQAAAQPLTSGSIPQDSQNSCENTQVCTGSGGSSLRPCDPSVATSCGVAQISTGCRIAVARPVLDAGETRLPGSSPDTRRNLRGSASAGALPRIPAGRPPEGHLRPHVGPGTRPRTRERTPARSSASHGMLPQLPQHGLDIKKGMVQQATDVGELRCTSDMRRGESHCRAHSVGHPHGHIKRVMLGEGL